MDAVFEKWCEKLLDTGKGNRLINFKDSKMRTMEVLAPGIDFAFEKIANGETLSFYEVDDYIRKMKDEDIVAEGENADQGKFDKVTRKQIMDELSDKLNKKQLLAYKKGFTLHKVLGCIKKTANNSLVEKGINILYITFGMLNWKESESSAIVFKSPLVLIPITLDNQSTTLPFTLTQYEDEVNTNPTLSYKLKNEYGINLPEFRDEKHEDETITQYLERVGKTVEKQGWFVTPDMQIGTFSFLKINMYKDLKENEAKILANPTIKKILNRQVDEKETDSGDIDIDDYFKQGLETNLHNVVDADSSQTAAIIQAKAGKSFVLQGPPGTGKSQTITNLIAEFLYDGKKILFVSEKLAALNVVYNNLAKVGLSDFCLELHSNKTNKKDVIAELYRVLNRNKKSVKADAEAVLAELRESKEQLDKYAEVMHTAQECINRTPYQILGAISKNRDVPTFEYAIDKIETKDLDYLKQVLTQLEAFVKYNDTIGFDYHKNAWYGYTNQDSSYQSRINFKKQLNGVIPYLQELSKITKEISKEINIEMRTLSVLDTYVDFIRYLPGIKFFDNNIFSKEKLEKIIKAIKTYNTDVESHKTAKAEVAKTYTDELYEIKVNDYYLRFKNEFISKFRIFNGNYRRDKKVLQQYQANPKQKLKYAEVVAILKEAKAVQQLQAAIPEDEKAIFALLAQKKAEDRTYDWIKIQEELEQLDKVLDKNFNSFAKVSAEEFAKIQDSANKFINLFDNTASKRETIDALQESFDKDLYEFNEMTFDSLVKRFKACLDNFDYLENWIKFNEVMRNLDELGLREFVDKSIELKVKRETLDLTYKQMFYTQWMYHILNKNDILHNFSRLTQDAAAANFKKKDKLKFEISKAEIIAKVTSDMPTTNNMASGSQVSTLVREANKKSKQKPVRLLLRDIGQLVQKLKPCFLMSPLSVSTYLDSDTCKFDVIIFDEASQIFPWDAIGAISRAKQVIVVGDSKQMPPSNFFNAGMIEEELEDEDEYEDDSLDFESILDLCTAVFKQNWLSWHYRSKTEDLIAFSNSNFYDGHLVTFPSAHQSKDTGVDFYYVPNGVFDRKSKTNTAEAEKVVDLVFEHFKQHPERSLGVVAFSISQQAEIEELIQKRRDKDDRFAEYFDSKRPEPFFVKNLETVQGDERDTIIFSVAYAKDSAGKFYHNFGPLNRQGGERRLNVAVTRAKYNVKLVASIKAYDIDLGKTQALGARLLRDYLDCAEHGMNVLKKNTAVDPNAESESDFEMEVYDVIKAAGYEADKQVGCSGYRIDLGVKHPTKNDYVLAIECDGATYHSGKTTRDRDRLRQEVLEKLGWKFYRIWSTDWFTNKAVEKKKMIEAIEKAIVDFDKGEEVKKDFTPTNDTPCLSSAPEETNFIVEEEIDQQDLKSLFKEYETYDIYSKRLPSFDNTIYDLVKIEQPITEELLLRKTVEFFDREKVTNVVRNNFKWRMRYQPKIFKIRDYYVVDKNLQIEMRIPKEGEEPRDIMMISNAELESGMLVIIENNLGITQEGLFSTMAGLLGFTRKGNNIMSKLTTSLNELVKNGLVKELNGEFFIK